jgi:hypothetical protein
MTIQRFENYVAVNYNMIFDGMKFNKYNGIVKCDGDKVIKFNRKFMKFYCGFDNMEDLIKEKKRIRMKRNIIKNKN